MPYATHDAAAKGHDVQAAVRAAAIQLCEHRRQPRQRPASMYRVRGIHHHVWERIVCIDHRVFQAEEIQGLLVRAERALAVRCHVRWKACYGSTP